MLRLFTPTAGALRTGPLRLLLPGFVVLAVGCTCAGPTPPPTGEPRPNVLLVLLDDVGIDKLAPYGVGTQPPALPTIEALAEEGVVFTQAYADPSCSPTRLGILTGQHAMRLGVGNPLNPREHSPRPDRMWTLPMALSEGTGGAYQSLAVGKWHMSTPDAGLDMPQRAGFDHFAGSMANFDAGAGEDYRSWDRVVNGKTSRVSKYNTTDIIDSAQRLLGRVEAPWFMWMAFHAGHVPLHRPPEDLLPQPLPPNATSIDRYDAMLQAADHELGRFLRSLDAATRARTVIIVMGDNGTSGHVVRPPFPDDKGKFSVYEGGTHVPLIVAGPGIDGGRRIDGLVSHLDLFPTIVGLGGGEIPAGCQDALDGISILPALRGTGPLQRARVYAEYFRPNGFDIDKRFRWDRMILEGDHKLITRAKGPDELYRVDTPGIDGPNLRDPAYRTDAHEATASALRASLTEHYPPPPDPRANR